MLDQIDPRQPAIGRTGELIRRMGVARGAPGHIRMAAADAFGLVDRHPGLVAAEGVDRPDPTHAAVARLE